MLSERQRVLLDDCLTHRSTRGMLYNFARSYGFEYDDLYQEAALRAIEILMRKADIQSSNYLTRAIHLELIDLAEKCDRDWHLWHLSLDMKMGDDEESVGPWLIDKPRRTGDKHSERKARALYKALSRLHPEEQAYFKRVYSLHDYTGPEQVETTRRVDYIMRNAYAKVRRDKELARSMAAIWQGVSA
jgi:DNA-directed RNA polymerase specialized sigma24 family protein